MMADELAAPCPFCGGDDLKFELGGCVRCVSCCADGPFFDGQPDDEWEAKALALWNTREHIALTEQLAEMRRERDALAAILRSAPEAYDYMSKTNFRDLPTPMRGFVDAWKQWIMKARAALASGTGGKA